MNSLRTPYKAESRHILPSTDLSSFIRDYDAWRTPYNPQLKHFRPNYLSRDESIAYIINKNLKRLPADNPDRYMIKATDDETGEIIGFAVWQVNDPAEDTGEKTVAHWYEEGSEQREFAECFIDGLWGFLAERVTRRHMGMWTYPLLSHVSQSNFPRPSISSRSPLSPSSWCRPSLDPLGYCKSR